MSSRRRPSRWFADLAPQNGLLRSRTDLVDARGSRDSRGVRLGDRLHSSRWFKRPLCTNPHRELHRRASPVVLPSFSLTPRSQTPLWEPPPLEIPEALLLASPSNHLEVEALAAFANLSNHILATKASKTLARLKGRHRDLFSSSSLYYRALEMLANHHYRLAVRRYIIELFDVALDDRTALEIMNAGEELKARHLEEETTVKLPVKMAAVDAILEGIEGEFTDDDESSLEEGATVMPLQILAPLLTIRGFIL